MECPLGFLVLSDCLSEKNTSSISNWNPTTQAILDFGNIIFTTG